MALKLVPAPKSLLSGEEREVPEESPKSDKAQAEESNEKGSASAITSEGIRIPPNVPKSAKVQAEESNEKGSSWKITREDIRIPPTGDATKRNGLLTKRIPLPAYRTPLPTTKRSEPPDQGQSTHGQMEIQETYIACLIDQATYPNHSDAPDPVPPASAKTTIEAYHREVKEYDTTVFQAYIRCKMIGETLWCVSITTFRPKGF